MTGGERGASLFFGAVVGVFVATLATGAANWLGLHGWFNSGANEIQWMSGAATLSAVATYAWGRWTCRCAAPRCVRRGEHPVKGTLRKVCDHHHTVEFHHLCHDLHGELHRLSGRLGWGESHQREEHP